MGRDAIPAYVRLHRTGQLAERSRRLAARLSPCSVCPRLCQVNRLQDEKGACCSGHLPIVSAYGAHFGEEPPITGERGAGNIFFGNCNLRCVYCQNHQISQNPGVESRHALRVESLAEVMLELQARGCHNINLVSPTHFAPQIVRALLIAAEQGLRLPLVYNSNGYEALETLQLLDGIVDIYLPDLKYSDEENALRYSKIDSYVMTARKAIQEMHRQTGTQWITDAEGILKRGLIIRLLMLPNGLAGIEASLDFISSELGRDVAVSLMAQYYPAHHAEKQDQYPLLMRRISAAEWARALATLDRLGMTEGWIQDLEAAADCYRPDFANRQDPFNCRYRNSETIP